MYSTATPAADHARGRSADLELANATLRAELLRVESLLDDAQRQRRAAEVLTNAIEDVLGAVAHDLRNPLAVMSMTAQTVLDVPMEPSDQREHLSAIVRAGGVMNRLIGDLLDTVRLRTGQVAIDMEPLSVEAILRHADETFRSIADARGLHLSVLLPSQPLVVHADALRVTQIVGNLVNNALKFTPRGGSVTVSANAGDEWVVFEVSDNGAGISPQALDRVFDRYWQGRPDRDGIGLGLAVAKRLVEAHGGAIWVRSTVGLGTSFMFSLRVPGE